MLHCLMHCVSVMSVYAAELDRYLACFEVEPKLVLQK